MHLLLGIQTSVSHFRLEDLARQRKPTRCSERSWPAELLLPCHTMCFDDNAENWQLVVSKGDSMRKSYDSLIFKVLEDQTVKKCCQARNGNM